VEAKMTGMARDQGSVESTDVAVHLRAVIGRPQVSEAYVHFRLDMVAAQQAVRRALATRPPDGCVTGETPRLPMNASDVAFPADLLGGLLQALRAAAIAHGRETEDLRRLTAAAAADPDVLPRLAAAAAFGPDVETLESLARRWRVYVDALLFVGRTLASPCVAEAARVCVSAAGVRFHPTEPHRCPCCGSAPSVARLRRADGLRHLTCGLCGTEWQAMRLACACCGTPDRQALGVLRLEDADARWIETCERCKGYIKTVDERKLPDGETVVPVVEEAATLHLDLLAEREGYIRRIPYALSG